MTNEELVAAIQNGERDRLLELWKQVERFIWLQAKRTLSLSGGIPGVDVEDLYQSGYFALLAAVETYKPTCDPSTDATFLGWLKYYLKAAFSEAGGYKTKRENNDPLRRAGSLDAPVNDNPKAQTLAYFIKDPENCIEAADERIYLEQLHAALEAALNRLPRKAAEVIREHYFNGRSLQELGPQAPRLKIAAMRRLRNPVIIADLKGFIEERTPYYKRVGISSFISTHTSTVENAVLAREELEELFGQERIKNENGEDENP